MLQAIFDNRLLLGAVVFLLLLMVPLVIMRGHKLRDPSHPERRKQSRPGVDRRA